MHQRLSLSKLAQQSREIIAYFVAIEASLMAAGLAYNTLFAIVPLMVLSLGFILAFPGLSSYFQAIHRALFQHVVPQSADSIQLALEAFANNAVQLSATGIIFFVLTALFLIFSLERAFNVIWRIKTQRRGLAALFMYCAILLVLPPLGATVFGLSLFLYSLSNISFITQVFSLFIPLALNWLFCLLLYKIIPNTKVAIRSIALGALTAAVLFEIMKALFRIYLRYFSSDALIYGVLAAIPSLLLWLYLSWSIIILGAVISYKLSSWR